MDWIENQRVRFYGEYPEREPQGTVVHVDSQSDHITIGWDDSHRPAVLGFAEANRKLERI